MNSKKFEKWHAEEFCEHIQKRWSISFNVDEINRIKKAYDLIEHKVFWDLRDNGEKVFDHLRGVAHLILDKNIIPNPSVEKVIIALLHDAIEDTELDFHTISKLFWLKIAIAVQSISKNLWQDYNQTDTEIWKKLRNKEYFWHLESFEYMLEYVRKLSKWQCFSEDELRKITQNALDVKFADRIHNLSTQWDPDNTEKVQRKIVETETYFLKIAKETNPDTYRCIQAELFKLKQQLGDYKGKVNEIVHW